MPTTAPSTPSTERSSYDVVVVGGGHNGLTAAAYLARAGRSVLVLERGDRVGGAAVSAQAFSGVPTRLSRYSYLVSLMPEQLMGELGLDVRLASRSVASYTPVVRDGVPDGLLVERPEGAATRASFRRVTGGDTEHAAWQQLYGELEAMAEVVAPTLMQPLPRERDLRGRVDPTTWRDVVVRPLGEALERRFADDTVRGVVATDALIGTFASLADASLAQNRCFLYHLVGNGTGEWRVPIGGMGAVTDALAASAVDAGAELVTGAEVTGIDAEVGAEVGAALGAGGAEVRWRARGSEGPERVVAAGHVLVNVSPWTLESLLGRPADPATKPSGSQLKVNLLLTRLPRLRSGIDPRVAFAGTLHLDEGWGALQAAYDDAAAGRVPARLPGEVYCHTLTDPSILGDVPDGTHTLTYFGLHTPAGLFDADPEHARALALRRAMESLDSVLLDPIGDVVARDAHGRPCIEVKIPQDVEADLGMPGGHIFHGDLAWPWAGDDEPLETPAQRWGVETASPAVLLCGSGARRGGAVSGLGGHGAAMAVLES